MFKSYCKVALRSFIKGGKYSIINISGLVIGMASVFIILAYIKYETSYDKHYSNSSRIYRMTQTSMFNDAMRQSVYVPLGLGPVLKQDVPGIEATTIALPYDDEFLINNQPVKIKCLATGSNFFNIFNLPLKYGGPSYVLNHNNDVVVSESFAAQHFPDQNPVGKQLFTKSGDATTTYTITGVMQNIPANTHFKTDIVIAATVNDKVLNLDRGYGQYIMLNKNTSIARVQKSMPGVYAKYNFPSTTTIHFQPVTSIHLHSNIPDERFSNSSITYIYVFLFMAIFTLLIACINYINLNTAKSLQRIKEIGVRKVMGAQQKQLSLRFISESVLFFCAAIPFALLLAYGLWPLFTSIVNIPVPHSYLLGKDFILILLGTTLVTGVLSGAYSAFFVVRLRPAHILKDWQKSFVVNMRVRKALIVFQFAISVALIIATVIANQQLYLLNNMQLGFNRQQLIVLPEQRFKNSSQPFKDALLKDPNISSVSISGWDVGKSYGGFAAMDMPGDTTAIWQINVLQVDPDFFNTMQAKLLAGRGFSRQHAEDMTNIDSIADAAQAKNHLSFPQKLNILSARSIIVSAPIAQMAHLKQPVVGSVLKYDVLCGTVVGEVKDFIGTSLMHKTPAVIFTVDPDPTWGYTYIRVGPQNMQASISHIHNTWQKFFPANVFDFSFVDDRLNQQFDSQTRMAAIFNTFAALAVIIALLGLFSLVALTVQQKTKEIGIRKVLGARITDIIALLSKGYISLIIIAALIAAPATWWAMSRWLQDFNYRITIHWWVFIAVTIGCLLLALLSIFIQTIKVARANPVDSLRTE